MQPPSWHVPPASMHAGRVSLRKMHTSKKHFPWRHIPGATLEQSESAAHDWLSLDGRIMHDPASSPSAALSSKTVLPHPVIMPRHATAMEHWIGHFKLSMSER